MMPVNFSISNFFLMPKFQNELSIEGRLSQRSLIRSRTPTDLLHPPPQRFDCLNLAAVFDIRGWWWEQLLIEGEE